MAAGVCFCPSRPAFPPAVDTRRRRMPGVGPRGGNRLSVRVSARAVY